MYYTTAELEAMIRAIEVAEGRGNLVDLTPFQIPLGDSLGDRQIYESSIPL